MSLVLSDRVKETSTTSGTGTIVLGGAVGGFVSFSSGVGEGNKTYYVIENDTRWEIGIGTFSSGSLSRDTVLSSSSGGKVDLSGVSFVFVALPASKTVIKGESDFDLEADLVTVDNVITDDITVKKYALLNNVASSGEIISSGFLTLSRTNAGNFFHAYVDDSNDKTISLYSDASSAPEWKLGLKADPSNQTDPPTYAYIHGEDGNIGLYANSLNTLSLSHGAGFTLTNKGNTIITSASTTGTVVNAQAAAYPVLTLKGATSHSANLQEWQSVIGTVLSSVSSDGSLTVKGSDVLSSIDANTVSGVAISGWAEAYVDAQDHSATSVSGSLQPQITQNAEDIVTVSGLTSAGVDALPHVSGEYFLQLIDDNSVSGVAMSGYTNDAVSSGISASGNANRDFTVDVSGALQPQITQYTDQILANSASGYVISGVAIDASGWNKHFTEQLDRLPHASGYYFLQLIDDNSASGTSNLDANLSTSGYFDQVLGSGSYLGIIPTAVSGYIDYALGSGIGDIRINSASGTNHAADIIRNAASGTATNTSVATNTTNITNNTADMLRMAASGTNHAADIIRNAASGTATNTSVTNLTTELRTESASGTQAFAELRSGFAASGLNIKTNIGDTTTKFIQASGMSVSGIMISGAVPPSTVSMLYNDGGTLKWDGSAIGGGGGGDGSAADILANSASGVNHAADIIRNAASGTATNTAVTSLSAELVTESASGTQAFAEFRSGFAASGITYANGADNRVATFTDTNALNGEVNLTFDGSTLKLINGHTRFSVANDGGVVASGDITTSGIVNASGMSVSGLYLADYVPTSTSNRLYNEGGTLKFDGSAVGGGGGDGSAADILANSASGVNHAADIIRNAASGTAVLAELRTESASGVNHAADIIRNAASGTAALAELRIESASGVNHAADILRNAASGTAVLAELRIESASGTQAFAEFRSGFAASGLTYANGADNRIATFTDTNALNGEANFTFDGSILKIITGDTRFSVTNEGYVFASGDVTSSGTVISSGVSTSGVYLQPIAAAALHSTTHQLYHETGILKFNGQILTSGAATPDLIDHDALTNFVANEHVDHTSVTLTAGDGLTGGGTIASNRTFAVSVDDSTIEIDSDSLRVKDNGITLAKMAGITRGSIIIGDSSGDPAALAIGSNTYVLTSDGTDIAWASAGGGSSRSVAGDTDDGIITWKTSDNTFIAESNFTFDGSTLKIITGDTRFSVTNEGYVFASGDVTSSGTVISSGVSTSGVHLQPIAATALHSTTHQLYQEDGMLKFNGKILTSGTAVHSDTTYTAGDGLTLTSTDFDLDAALTTVTSLLAADIKIGEDDQTKVDFEDANQINFYADNLKKLEIKSDGIAVSGAIRQLPNTNTQDNSLSEILNIDCSTSNYHEVLLTEDVSTINFTNATAGQRIIVRVKQHSTHVDLDPDDGWDSVTVNGSTGTLHWPGGTEPSLTAANNAIDMFGFIFTSTVTTMHGFVIGQDIKA